MKNEADFIALARKRFAAAESAEKENRTKATEDLKFLDGDQWDDKERQKRKDERRPCLTINMLPKYVDGVTGESRRNDLAIKVHPIDDQGDKEGVKAREGKIREIEDRSDADVAYDTAAESAASCGFGYFMIVLKYADDEVSAEPGGQDFEKEIWIEAIPNAFTVYCDPSAQKYHRNDGDFFFVSWTISRDEYKEKYKGKEPSAWDTGEGDSDKTRADESGDDEIRIAKYYVKERETSTIHLLRNDKILTDAALEKLRGEAQAEGWPEAEVNTRIAASIKETRKVKGHKIVEYLVDGKQILEGPTRWPSKYFPVIPVWGKELIVDGKRKVRGVIRHAKDPQRAYNYWRSVATETLALAPKVPWLVTAKMIAGHLKFWKKANKEPLDYLPFEPDERVPGAIPIQKAPPLPPAGYIQDTQLSRQELDETTGVYAASRGEPSNEKSGKAIEARRGATDSLNYVYHDNRRRAIRQCGRVLLDMMPRVYDTPRTMRVLAENGDESFVQTGHKRSGISDEYRHNPGGPPPPGMKKHPDEGYIDLGRGKYDATVSVGPAYATKRAEAADNMIKLLDILPPEASGATMDLIPENLDFPKADVFAERLKFVQNQLYPGIRGQEEGEAPPPPEPPPPPDPVMEAKAAKAQAEVQKAELEVKGKELDNQMKMAELAAQMGEIQAHVQEVREFMAAIRAGGQE